MQYSPEAAASLEITVSFVESILKYTDQMQKSTLAGVILCFITDGFIALRLQNSLLDSWMNVEASGRKYCALIFLSF